MDDSHTDYAPDTTDRLLELFKDAFGDYFKSYWEAAPNTIPGSSDFPLLIISKRKTKATVGPTSTDEVPETIDITVMLNKADDAGSANVRTTTQRHLEHLVEGQDPATLQYKTNSILGVIRTYLTLLQTDGSVWLLDSDADISYSQIAQADTPALAVADITLTTQRRVIVSRIA